MNATNDDTKAFPSQSQCEDDGSSVEHCEHEREHIENVLMNRFDYFIVFFGVAIAGAAATDSHVIRALVLGVAAAISIPIAMTLSRAQTKLDLAFEHLISRYPKHPAAICNNEANKVGSSKRGLVGRTIPQLCTAFLIGGAGLSAGLAIRGESITPGLVSCCPHRSHVCARCTDRCADCLHKDASHESCPPTLSGSPAAPQLQVPTSPVHPDRHEPVRPTDGDQMPHFPVETPHER